MNKLFIDTSTQTLMVILFQDNKVVDYHIEIVVRDHASKLLPAIDTLFSRNNLASNSLDEVYVSEGPGSYTGVRIGVTVAKVLCYSLNIPMYSIPSLKVIAASYVTDADYLVPLIDARRGNVFSAIYQVVNGKLETVLPENLYALEDIIKYVKSNNYNNYFYVGLDSSKFTDLIDSSRMKANLNEDIKPLQILNLDFQLVEQIHAFVPSYKRITEAERNLL